MIYSGGFLENIRKGIEGKRIVRRDSTPYKDIIVSCRIAQRFLMMGAGEYPLFLRILPNVKRRKRSYGRARTGTAL